VAKRSLFEGVRAIKEYLHESHAEPAKECCSTGQVVEVIVIESAMRREDCSD